MDGKSSFYGHEARECHVSFYQQHVRVTLDQPKQSSQRVSVTTSGGPMRENYLCLSTKVRILKPR